MQGFFSVTANGITWEYLLLKFIVSIIANRRNTGGLLIVLFILNSTVLKANTIYVRITP
jgi:hypothetical protein